MARSARTFRFACMCSAALLTGLVAWPGLRAQTAAPQATTPPPTTPPAGATPAAPATAAAPQPPSPNVQIVFVTVPPANATVTWGKTRLGRTAPGRALVVTRPRDSGPLDVVVRAPGFLPVHTRAHTFGDHRVSVKLTRVEDKATLLGYRAPLDAGVPLDPDAGVLTEMPPSLLFTPAPGTTPATPAPTPAPAPAPAPSTGATPGSRP